MESSSIIVKNFDATVLDKVIDLLYQFQTGTWEKFYEIFPSIQNQVATQVVELNNIYSMFGINLADKPDMMSIGVLIPILNVAVQFLVTQTSMAQNAKKNDGAKTQADQTNKTMMYTMPLVSGFFCHDITCRTWFILVSW